jgi:predicted RNase H-like HicB family nuclease
MAVKLSVVCREQSNGSYYAECPELDGCYTQGDTYAEALDNLRDLAASMLSDEPDEVARYFAGTHCLISEMIIDM